MLWVKMVFHKIQSIFIIMHFSNSKNSILSNYRIVVL